MSVAQWEGTDSYAQALLVGSIFLAAARAIPAQLRQSDGSDGPGNMERRLFVCASPASRGRVHAAC